MKWIIKMSCFLSLLTIAAFGSDQNVILISGGTGGLGLALARTFHENGWKVWAGSRNPNQTHEGFSFVNLDVTDEKSIQDCVDKILLEDGKIDLLINNAGYGIIGGDDEISIQEAQKLFDVNFFGSLRLIQAVVPSMKQKQSGHIMNISSTSGVRAVPGLGLYAASKFALEGISESLAVTLSPWNIHVSIIEPGTVKNDWAKHCVISDSNENAIYKKMTENLTAKLIQLAESGQDCKEIALLILEIAETPNPDMRYQTSEKVRDTLRKKLVDLSGNEMRDTQLLFFKTLTN